MPFPDTIPRMIDVAALRDDPLKFLAEARRRCGRLAVVTDGAPLFAPAAGCPGTVAVFGSDMHRRVLGDAERFVPPESTARALGLPEPVVNLNRSLHGMAGQEHSRHKAAIAALTGPGLLADRRHEVVAAVRSAVATWRGDGAFPVLAAMRDLMAEVAAILLLDGSGPGRGDVRDALSRFFEVRRRLSPATADDVARAGFVLDDLLGAAIAGAGHAPAGRLAREVGGTAARAHVTVLFMSLAEPVAVAAAWTLLVLSQRPGLRRRLRRGRPGAAASAEMERVVQEVLRLLSPNALMVRVASRDVACGGAVLPAGCEVVLAPFLSHRDPAIFAGPEWFRPERWREIAPSPFAYLPFGAGVHACVGRRLGMALVGLIVGEVLAQIDPVLTHEQSVDWRIDITFRPRGDVLMTSADDAGGSRDGPPVAWHGPVAELVRFGCDPD